MLLNSNSIHPLSVKLLEWYSVHKRDLPWRHNPKPYNVWLSEIIFQQTKIDQGIGYYEKIIEKFPSVYDLADASENDVLKVWEGLGYYSRARNLHYSAKEIVHNLNGKFPSDYKSILALKGVGPYTAAAILSIVYNLPYPAIDGNVLRVSSRLFLIKEPIDSSSTKKLIEEELNELIDQNRPGDFNQAMMELGALICKPRNPLCNECPISEFCIAYKESMQSELPIKKKKTKSIDVYFKYFIFYSNDHILIEKREEGIWKGMYQFPLKHNKRRDDAVIYDQIQDLYAVRDPKIIESEVYKHILSHRVIFAKFYLIKVGNLKHTIGYKKVLISKLNDYPMPRLIHRFLSSEAAVQNLM